MTAILWTNARALCVGIGLIFSLACMAAQPPDAAQFSLLPAQYPAASTPATVLAQAADTTKTETASADGDEMRPGRMTLQLRPRYTHISQTNKLKNAEGLNMRTLAGYRSAAGGDFRFTGQIINVSWLDESNATNQPGNLFSPYPLIADPDKSGVNLLFVDHTGLSDTRIRLGRQAIKLDNERFVGDADVRQTPQVFDAISVRNTSLADTTLYAAYIWQVRTYFGNRLPSNTTLLNARQDFNSGLSVGGYAYFTDQPKIENFTGLADNSNRITGIRFEGNYRTSDKLSWYYAAESARQSPYAGGSSRIQANYSRLAFGPTWGPYSLQFGNERLGSNRGLYAFQMPLSYNTFQGWAYEFFNTPPLGVRDQSVSAAAAYGRLNLWLKHHRFDADFGTLRYGHEWDFAAAYRINESTSIRAVLASFRGTTAFFRPSAERYYVTLQYDY